MLGDRYPHGYKAQHCFVSKGSGEHIDSMLKSRVGTDGTEPKSGDVKVYLVVAQMCFQNITGRAQSHRTFLLYLYSSFVYTSLQLVLMKKH